MELATAITWRQLLREQYVLAVDLGQSTDPTAIAVLHHQEVEQFNTSLKTLDERGGRETVETFDVRHLARLPLGLSYVDQVAEIRRLLARPPLVGNCTLCIDETGVGRAVGDIFSDAGLEPLRVTITAGESQSGSTGGKRWHVAKSLLISHLDARLHVGELRFAASLTEAGAMQEELKDFRRKVSAAGRATFEARVGKHDDLVLAVAIGLWALVGRPKPAYPTFGHYYHVRTRA
jgi:hypothetical protein